eukprot:13287489-Alexandrium_andersonii.AAC.1
MRMQAQCNTARCAALSARRTPLGQRRLGGSAGWRADGHDPCKRPMHGATAARHLAHQVADPADPLQESRRAILGPEHEP